MRLSIRAKMLIAFAVDLLLMVILGAFAAQQMGLMHVKATFVEQHTIPSLATVGQINGVVSRYRVQQLEYLIYSNPADKARAERKMRELEMEMAGSLAAYRPLLNDDAERQRFANVEAAWAELAETNHRSFLPAAELVNTGSVQPFYSRMNPLYDRLELAIEQLTAESGRQASDALGVVRSAYVSGRAFIIGDTILALVISAAIGLIFSARLAHRIRLLTGATVAVAAGDLSRAVTISGNDEVSLLSRNFNHMLQSLREQRQALEQRNSELARSLARQEQLTADLVRGKRAEAEAYSAQAAAEAASRAKSMFLATMSHELRTPLNAILGYAQVLRLTAPQRGLDPEAVDQLDRILRSGRHLTTLISNVLDFSKIEQGRADLHIDAFDVGALLREVAEVAAPLADRQGNRLALDYPPDLGPMRSDQVRLRQILINLLGNAAKFTEGGTITLRAAREADRADDGGALPPSAAGGCILFEVSDTGIGIPADQLDRLFQPFSQVDSSVTRRYEGTGLGLALSRQLALALGGEITVHSEPGLGSTFRLRLPAEPPAAPQTSPSALELPVA